MSDITVTSLLLFGFEKKAIDVSTKLLNLTKQFLKDSGRFDGPLI